MKIQFSKLLKNQYQDLKDNYIDSKQRQAEFIVCLAGEILLWILITSMNQLIDCVRHHHERYDGKGYPDHISGEEISLGARILCVADSFDAMVSDRPYRKSMSVEEAFCELERCSGTKFDPNIVKTFIKIMKQRMSIKYNYKLKNDEAREPALQNV